MTTRELKFNKDDKVVNTVPSLLGRVGKAFVVDPNPKDFEDMQQQAVQIRYLDTEESEVVYEKNLNLLPRLKPKKKAYPNLHRATVNPYAHITRDLPQIIGDARPVSLDAALTIVPNNVRDALMGIVSNLQEGESYEYAVDARSRLRFTLEHDELNIILITI